MPSVAVLITCHNRSKKTLLCLESLFANKIKKSTKISVFLVDDGSKDGTSSKVKKKYPGVNLIQGSGDLYWNGGMRIAFDKAMSIGFDSYLWLNDDCLLFNTTLEKILKTWAQLKKETKKDVIVGGSTLDPVTQKISYGGELRVSKWRPLEFRHILPTNKPQKCDVINGNFVLIPHSISKKLGNLDSDFVHSMGDIDYALRAKKIGIETYITPGFIGFCQVNPIHDNFKNKGLKRIQRFRMILDKKALPLKAWMKMTRRHCGFFWPIYWLAPYIKVFL